ncbi:helix-turn-helix domain-containing protein [Companilactobacillus huachuanensis]|uniref:Helix-turn-helix domain-containing protein n=1 Tax=Companilactobacillus huachuanensis TaxID=2559914 RepID=A0ABW1RKI0_9LACO|nr:AraC family transcriptional regulator [Companilactobacillus huachuanensis]
MATPMELLEFDYINPIKCIYHRPIGKKFIVPHWHEAIEICYVAKGNPGTMFIEDQEYQLKAGDVYIINSRLIHSFNTFITDDQRIVTLLINYDWLKHCLPQTVKQKSFDLIKLPNNGNQIPAFNELINLINNTKDFQTEEPSEDNHLNQLSTSIELISVLVKNFTLDKELKHDIPEVISQIIAEFHEQYQNEIQLSDMAKKYNYSYAYFSKMFKKYLGLSPKKYLTHLRVQKASELIENTDNRFTEIVTETGFPDEKSFYAAFKDRYHQTPLEYRRQLRLVSKR